MTLRCESVRFLCALLEGLRSCFFFSVVTTVIVKQESSVEAAKKQGGRAKLYCGGTKHTTMGQAEKRQEEGSYFHYLDSTLKFTKEL